MTTAPPRASVLMPAYGAEETIGEAVESVLAQTVENLELIVADDQSPVPVAEVLAGVRDPPHPIVRPAPTGVTARGRNSALAGDRAPAI